MRPGRAGDRPGAGRSLTIPAARREARRQSFTPTIHFVHRQETPLPDSFTLDLGPDDDSSPAALGARIRDLAQHHDEIRVTTDGLEADFTVHVRRGTAGTCYVLPGRDGAAPLVYSDAETLLRASATRDAAATA